MRAVYPGETTEAGLSFMVLHLLKWCIFPSLSPGSEPASSMGVNAYEHHAAEGRARGFDRTMKISVAIWHQASTAGLLAHRGLILDYLANN